MKKFERYKKIFKKHTYNKMDSLLENVLNVSITDVKFQNHLDALKWNGAFYKPLSETKYYDIDGQLIFLDEAITHEFKDKGGMIVFAVTVNATFDAKGFKNKVKNFFKRKFKSIINQLKRYSKIDTLLNDFIDVEAYSVGNLFKGKYKSPEGNLYDDTSLSLEIIGIPFELLISVAEAVTREFNQMEVLVKSYDNGRIVLVDRN